MGYWLEDADGKWLGDLASNMGMKELRDGPHDALSKFVEDAEADKELVKLVVEETEDDSELEYVAKMLKGAKTPVYITDGCGSVED